jgi:ArsR family metal-binding transcriptional regulator
MKKYNIIAYYTTCCFAEVEAKDEDEAYEIARNMDGGIFSSSADKGDWRIVDVEEIEE